jgi:hypothetical protein
MPPAWLTIVAWISLAVALRTAATIGWDIWIRGHRRRMWIMEVVWPIKVLYLGSLAWIGYRRWGLQSTRGHEDGIDYDGGVSVGIGVSHCGGGCTIGDILGAWIVFGFSLELLGLALPAEYIADFTLAFALGIAFQYFAIAPMRGLGRRDGLVAAFKADALSLVSFEVGLFGWMALMQLVMFTDPHLTPAHAAYWFLMQIGMILGFVTAYPINAWLISREIKEAM